MKSTNCNPKKNTHRIIAGTAIAVILVGGGAYAYTRYGINPQESVVQATLNTTTVKNGDLILYASGTGTLTAVSTASLGFETSGKVAKVYVEEGDTVEAGQILAELDSTTLQIEYNQVVRNLAEMVSPAAIALAEQTLADAKVTVNSTTNTLTSLISAQVFNRQIKLDAAQQALDEARSLAQSTPSEENAQAVTKAEADVTQAERNLKSAWYYWETEFLKEYFTVTERNSAGKRITYIAKPTEADIASAWYAYRYAVEAVKEQTNYVAALKGEEIPVDATGADLTAFEQAKQAVETAKEALDQTTIISPISGLVTSVSISEGDTVGSDAVIEIADNTTPQVEFYLDEEDWDNVEVGYPVEVIFDSLPDNTYTGEVIRVSPTLVSENNTTLVKGLAQLENVSEVLKDNLMLGLNGAVDVIGGEARNSALVSVDALHEVSPGVYGVFIRNNGALTFTRVEIGIMDSINAQVISGLKTGDVVSTGLLETN
jgi:multidrug efflux pump subunit AcrA (membrane-fusion protein)